MTKLTLNKSRLSLETQAKLYKVTGKTPAKPLLHSTLHTAPRLVEAPLIQEEEQTRVSYADKMKAVQKWLEETFPQAFSIKAPKPLKRRIENDILPLVPQHFSKNQVRQALTAYTNRKIYLEAILTSDWRYDLQGKKIEEISVSQKGHIHQKLALKKQRTLKAH